MNREGIVTITLRGERVVLRPLEEGDLEKALPAWTPELRHMYGGSLSTERPPTLENRRRTYEALRADERNHCFAIEANGCYIGFAVIRITDEGSRKARYRIGIEDSAYWGRGYGTEATRLLLGHAFRTLHLHRVELRVASYNTRAIRCYEGCGFRHEGIERESFLVDGTWEDDVLMAILRDDWEKHEAGACPGVGEVAIRSYRVGDYDEVVALWSAVWPGPRRRQDSEEALRYKLTHDRGPFLVAEADGRIVGTAMGSWDGRRPWISRVAVAPDMRRCGIGRRLMAEVERGLAALGADRFLLDTGAENAVAQSFYESQGYHVVDGIITMRKVAAPEEARHGS
jgi:ribosomal-protein-alanine N-acetyltransferase